LDEATMRRGGKASVGHKRSICPGKELVRVLPRTSSISRSGALRCTISPDSTTAFQAVCRRSTPNFDSGHDTRLLVINSLMFRHGKVSMAKQTSPLRRAVRRAAEHSRHVRYQLGPTVQRLCVPGCRVDGCQASDSPFVRRCDYASGSGGAASLSRFCLSRAAAICSFSTVSGSMQACRSVLFRLHEGV